MTKNDWEQRLKEQIPRLRRYAKALTRNTDLSEDLMQDCLERAWSRRLLWNPARELRPWLFTIMHNIFINQINRYENKSVIKTSENLDDLPDGQQQNSLLFRDFERSMAQLSAEQRSILLLVGLEGLSYKEVSSVMNLPLGTVMSRLHRAREKLRQLMDGSEELNVVPLK